jgi:hypothetical protein
VRPRLLIIGKCFMPCEEESEYLWARRTWLLRVLRWFTASSRRWGQQIVQTPNMGLMNLVRNRLRVLKLLLYLVPYAVSLVSSPLPVFLPALRFSRTSRTYQKRCCSLRIAWSNGIFSMRGTKRYTLRYYRKFRIAYRQQRPRRRPVIEKILGLCVAGSD